MTFNEAFPREQASGKNIGLRGSICGCHQGTLGDRSRPILPPGDELNVRSGCTT